LRSYPLREADLLVTFFTRSHGKLRGVARSAKKSKKRFGGALEPLTYVRAYFEQKERQELVRLDSCEVIESPLTAEVDYPRAVALGHVAEMMDELLPDHEANDAVFRLAISVLMGLRGGQIWLPTTYFDLWMSRLTGLLPEMDSCIECGSTLNGSKAWFHPLSDGLMCANDKRLASTEIAPESRALAREMFRNPLEHFATEDWPRARAADLRRFVMQLIERQVDKKLMTTAMLARLD
jgi:DNA repair protein RecO (recombination protein O)